MTVDWKRTAVTERQSTNIVEPKAPAQLENVAALLKSSAVVGADAGAEVGLALAVAVVVEAGVALPVTTYNFAACAAAAAADDDIGG